MWSCSRNLVCGIASLAFATACFGQAALVDVGGLGRNFDSDGHVDYWNHVADITGPGTRIPLLLNFNSGSEGGYLLPGGWRIPLLESRAVMLSENWASVILPSGRELVFNRGANGEFNPSGGWKATVKGRRLELSKADQSILFEDGKIAECKSGERGFRWSYDKTGELEAIEDLKQVRLLTVRTERSGPHHAMVIQLNGSKSPVRVEYVQVPMLADEQVKSLASVSNWSPGVELVQSPSGEKISFERNASGGEVALDVKHASKVMNQLAWDEKTQKITRDANNSMSVSYLVEGANLPEIASIDRETGNLKVLQECLRIQNGVVQQFQRSGSSVLKYYSKLPTGQHVLRKEEVVDEKGKRMPRYGAAFDDSGNVARDQRGSFTRILENGVYKVFKDGVLIREY